MNPTGVVYRYQNHRKNPLTIPWKCWGFSTIFHICWCMGFTWFHHVESEIHLQFQESYNTPLEHTRSAIPRSPTMKGIPFIARWKRFRGLFQRCVETTLDQSGSIFKPAILVYQSLHPRKLTCPLKREYFNRKYIFQPSFFRGYVSFLGGKASLHPKGSLPHKTVVWLAQLPGISSQLVVTGAGSCWRHLRRRSCCGWYFHHNLSSTCGENFKDESLSANYFPLSQRPIKG